MGLNKFKSLFFMFFIIVFMVFTIGLVNAAHTHTATITPQYVLPSTEYEYTINVLNNGNDSINKVSITRPTNNGDILY